MSKESIRNTPWAIHLVETYLPFNQTETMKSTFGIELVPVFRGSWMELRGWFTKEGYFAIGVAGGSSAWYNGGPLTFGSMCGWDVTEDGKYALCRISYEDYRVFKVVECLPTSKDNAMAAMPIEAQELIKEMQNQIQELRVAHEKIMQQLQANQSGH
jgi:hypothetical protein